MNQGTRTWSLCYHSTKLPVTTFVHLDDVNESNFDSTKLPSFTEESPNAISTLIEPNIYSQTDPYIKETSVLENSIQEPSYRTPQRSTVTPYDTTDEFVSHDVGHISHIPRVPPSQGTFTIPSIANKSIQMMHDHEEDLFGMIKLRDNDVCYTSGTIEWVGKKRNYPINSGFKLIEETGDYHSQCKKLRKLNKTTSDVDKLKDCDCADVLPTVNAIIDHLNALHEAVDLVDLRLNTLEDTKI